MKSAEEIANEITNWLAKIGCALENSEEELLIGRIRAIQSDARESSIREAAQIASDKADYLGIFSDPGSRDTRITLEQIAARILALLPTPPAP